jgi:hypothetical protein
MDPRDHIIEQVPFAPERPGDEVNEGTAGSAEGLCRACGGSGVTSDRKPCPECKGTGRVSVGIGGG